MHSERNRRLKTIATVLIFAFAVLWFFKDTVMTHIGGILIADSNAINDGEVGVLLMGDRTGERAESALIFLTKHPSSHLLLAPEEATPWIEAGRYPHAHDVHKRYLLDAGVPEDRILVPACYNTSTHDEAVCFRDYLRTHYPDAKSVVVITSWYHSGRAVWTFENVFAETGLKVKSFLPDVPTAKPDLWWRAEYTFLAVFNEYLKWAYWLMKSP